MSEITVNEQTLELVINALSRRLDSSYGNLSSGQDQKHQLLYCDYGYPENITFEMCYQMYKRNGYATAGINHAVETCFQDYPQLLESEKTHDLTQTEQVIAEQLTRLKFWAILAEADKYSRVGEYAGVIFRFRDGKTFDKPVDGVNNGLEGVAEMVPAWQGQLTPLEIDMNETSETYGQVTMYVFDESGLSALGSVNGGTKKARKFNVHPSRVHIWSANQTVYGNRMVLEPGFNDLLTIQKVIGGGGEGFWKNAKAAPIMNVDKDTKAEKLAQMLNVPVTDIADKVDEIVRDFNTGLDATMMFQGIDVKAQAISMLSPEKFVLVAAQSFAASINEPLKLLVGNQNGERASTEDNKQWNKTCNSRRTNYCKPNIMGIIEKFVAYNILPKKSYYLLWSDLTESTTDEKIGIADKMATVNQKLLGTGEVIFTTDEIRETAGYKAIPTQALPARTPTKDEPTD